MINIIYLRVSKEEKNLQDLTPQREAIISKYNPIKPIILEDRGSAYDITKLHKRKEFMNLLNLLFDSDKTTIKDLFLRNNIKKDITLYVWDYHRIMRNFEFSLLFGILSDLFNINIISYNEGPIKKQEEETPIMKFSRYIFYSINAFSGEDYSYHISENIKKAVRKKDNITFSNKGNKWGRQFKNLEGDNVELTQEQIKGINKRIIYLVGYYKRQKRDFFYSDLIRKIGKEYNIKISKAYITKIRGN